MINIKQLSEEFIGIGSVRGFRFAKIASTQHAYTYEVTTGEGSIHFEVFKRKNVPTCINYENKTFDEQNRKEVYPKNEDFGKWAWTYKSKELAIEKMKSIHD